MIEVEIIHKQQEPVNQLFPYTISPNLHLILSCQCISLCLSLAQLSPRLSGSMTPATPTQHPPPPNSLFQAVAPAVHTSYSGKQQIFRIWCQGKNNWPRLHWLDNAISQLRWGKQYSKIHFESPQLKTPMHRQRLLQNAARSGGTWV